MEQQQATANLSESPTLIDVEQAEAAIVEHYPRLVRLAYLVLPPGVGRTRRVLAAHALAQRALPRNRATSAGAQTGTGPGLPGQRGSQSGPEGAAGAAGDGGYAFVRLRVLR
ncbi:hypothetical protein AB4Z54_75095, partial [Streptomyces sp. MCAF7]